MVYNQMRFNNPPNPKCPFIDLLDPDDSICYEFYKNPNYEVIAEDHPDFALWLSQINGVGFDDLNATATPNINLPDFIPVIPGGSRGIMQNNLLPFVGVNLGDIVPFYQNNKTLDLRRHLGVSPGTKIILFNYGKDKLIEEIWPNREHFYRWIATLNFDLITSINYSIWLDQPHAERLINVKRNILTFVEMQKIGLPAIPHLYWSGKHDIDRLIDWLDNNSTIKTIALNLQTLKTKADWAMFINDLSYFAKKSDPNIHYLVSGPSTVNRIQPVNSILKNITFANSACALNALSKHKLVENNGQVKGIYDPLEKHLIFADNINFYHDVIQQY